MLKSVYSIWKKHEDDEDAVFLEKEGFFHFKLFAFRRAIKLAKAQPKGWGYTILVRKITKGNPYVKQWEFSFE